MEILPHCAPVSNGTEEGVRTNRAFYLWMGGEKSVLLRECDLERAAPEVATGYACGLGPLIEPQTWQQGAGVPQLSRPNIASKLLRTLTYSKFFSSNMKISGD